MARNVVSLILAAAVTLAAPLATAQAQVSEDVVTTMSNDDPVMRKAFRRARAELDAFLETARAPASHQSDFAVKVGLREGERTEYVWISDFKEDARGNFSGVINNEIQIATQVQAGRHVSLHQGGDRRLALFRRPRSADVRQLHDVRAADAGARGTGGQGHCRVQTRLRPVILRYASAAWHPSAAPGLAE